MTRYNVIHPENLMTKRYDVIHPETSGLLGSVCYYGGRLKGWLFISFVSSHGNTRKPRQYAHQAVPAWARKMGAKLV